MPTSPPAGWFIDPDGSGGQRYWDGERWTKDRRSGPRSGLLAGIGRRWDALSTAPQLLVVVVLVAALISVGWALVTERARDDWAALPDRLNCQIADGPKPPEGMTIASVEAKQPRGGVLQLTVHFAKPLPPSPTGAQATRFVGYVPAYSVANDGRKFAELGPEQDSDDLAITSTLAADPVDSRIRPDRDTNARRTSPDTVQILLDLARLGVGNQLVVPELTLNARFDTPSITTVRFAAQVCRG